MATATIETLTQEISSYKQQIRDLQTAIDFAYARSVSSATSALSIDNTESMSEFVGQYKDVREAEKALEDLASKVRKLVVKRSKLKGYRQPPRHSK